MDTDETWDIGFRDAVSSAEVRLSDVLSEQDRKLICTYDFGDNYRHLITRMAELENVSCYRVKSKYEMPRRYKDWE